MEMASIQQRESHATLERGKGFPFDIPCVHARDLVAAFIQEAEFPGWPVGGQSRAELQKGNKGSDFPAVAEVESQRRCELRQTCLARKIDGEIRWRKGTDLREEFFLVVGQLSEACCQSERDDSGSPGKYINPSDESLFLPLRLRGLLTNRTNAQSEGCVSLCWEEDEGKQNRSEDDSALFRKSHRFSERFNQGC